MVIDDDPGLLGFTCKYLSRLGYPVVAYRNSDEAWSQFNASASTWALVVIDASLPGLSGLQLARMILNANPAVRVVLTSGYPFDSQKLLELSPDRAAFLHKPFTPVMLAEAVERLIGATPAADAD
jgi:CheY-like chemotaxis protein